MTAVSKSTIKSCNTKNLYIIMH